MSYYGLEDAVIETVVESSSFEEKVKEIVQGEIEDAIENEDIQGKVDDAMSENIKGVHENIETDREAIAKLMDETEGFKERFENLETTTNVTFERLDGYEATISKLAGLAGSFTKDIERLTYDYVRLRDQVETLRKKTTLTQRIVTRLRRVPGVSRFM